MSLFDHRPNLFRVLFLTLVLYLLTLSIVGFYRYGSSPTDENWFRNPASLLYVTSAVPSYAPGSDGLRVGDLLISIDRKRVERLVHVAEVLATIDAGKAVVLDVERPSENRTLTATVSRSALPDTFVREIPQVALVFDVIKDGASDRAGMKPGDLILTINGQSFENANQADKILRQAQIGKAIDYKILRDNRIIVLHVTLAAFGVPIGLVMFVLSGLAYMGVGVFIGLRRPRFLAARLLGMAFVLIGFFMTVAFTQRDVSRDIIVILRQISLLAAVFLGPVLFFHSGHYFPSERPELLARKWIRVAPYGLAGVAIAMSFWAGDVAFIIGLISVLSYAVGIRIAFFKQCPEAHKKLMRVIRWTGIGAGMLAGSLATWMLITRSSLLIPVGLIGVILVAIPIAYLYTIGRHRLLDMNLRIRRSVQYTLASSVWTIAVATIFIQVLLVLPSVHMELPNIRLTGASIEVLDTPATTDQRETVERFVVLTLGLLAAVVLWKGRRAGQRFLDRRFHRSAYDYRRASADLARVMATKLNMQGLARGIVEKLAELMHLKRVGVLFFRGHYQCCCQEAYGFDGTRWNSFCLSAGAGLPQEIDRFHTEFPVHYLPASIREELDRQDVRYVIPIRSQERLIGALLVGEKLSESTFRQEDLEFLGSVATQASVAIENAFLYEELTEQERLKHELAIARRIQLESLPQTTPTMDGLDISGISIPAMEVGGDYFDYLDGSAHKLTVIVGDVSGKGTSAALYMSKVQGILRSLHGFGLSPRELFIRANRLLRGDIEKRSFITAIGGEFDTTLRALRLSRAGHLPLFYYKARTRTVERIVPRGLGLALSTDRTFAEEIEERTMTFDRGDVFLFISDGVTEEKHNGVEFGEDRLEELLARSAGSRAETIRNTIVDAVRNFAADTPQHDDQTIVVVKAV